MKGAYFEKARSILIKEDLPKPSIKSDEVLIKVKNCGICGSDISSYMTGQMESTQIILGHEFSGELVEIGDNVKKMKIGDRVTINPNIPCSNCYFCNHGMENMCIYHTIGITHNGALAEYVSVRADRVRKLPDNVTFEEGAMVEPISNAVQAVKAAGFEIGKNAAVFGAGTIGLMVIQVLKGAGASNIFVIEPIESKRKRALELGADYVFDAKSWSKILRLTNKLGPDFVFDCVGYPETIINSMQLVKMGGFIMMIGIHPEPFELRGFMQFMTKNITMKGMYLVDQDSIDTAIRLLEQNKINVHPLITKKIKLDQVPEEFEKLIQPHEDIKILVEID